MFAAFPGISTWLIISRCWQIKLGQRRRKQSAWKLLIMRAKWEASWISKGGFMLQILRKSDCQQITPHRIPTIPPYGDAGGLWLQVGMKRWRGEEIHNWRTLEFGPEWWQTGSTWSNIRTHQGLCVSWYNTICHVQNRRDSNSKCYFGSTTATKKKDTQCQFKVYRELTLYSWIHE